MIDQIITAALEAISKGLELANTNAAKQHNDRLAEIRKQLLEEREKGYYSDDPKIEHLYQEMAIELEAAKNELILALSNRK
jgi:hypothetical protein